MCWVMPPASPLDHVGRADGVEQRGLAVVDVAHDGDDRRRAARSVAGSSAASNRPSSTSASATRLTVWPSSSAMSWAVSASITSLIFAIWPCFISSLMTSTRALRHAVGELLDGDRLRDRHFADELFLRLVVAVAGAALHAAAERRDGALAHFVGAERGDERQAAAPLRRALGRAGRRCGGGCRARRRRRAAARRRGRFVFFGFERQPGARAGGAGCAVVFLLAEALLGDLVGLALGLVVVLAALVFLALARFGGVALGLLDGFALLRGSRASSSAILRSSASRRRASPSAWARRLRSSSVSVRSTTPDGQQDDESSGGGEPSRGAQLTRRIEPTNEPYPPVDESANRAWATTSNAALTRTPAVLKARV